MNKSICAFFISKDGGNLLVRKENTKKTALQFKSDSQLNEFLEDIAFNCFISEDKIIRIKAFDSIEISIRAYLIERESDIKHDNYCWIDTEPVIISDKENVFLIDVDSFIKDDEFYIVQTNQITNEKTNICKEQFCEYLSLHSKGDLKLNTPIKKHFTPKNGERSGK